MLKTIGCKIPAELYSEIINELNKIGKTKSDFFRELIYNYIKDHWSDRKNLVNQLTTPVNQSLEEDEYQNTIQEVDGFLKSLNKDIKKTKL